MANNNMEQFLINKWNGVNFGSDFSNIAGYPTTDYNTNDAYFFLRRELDEVKDYDSFRAAQLEKKVRHCKLYCNRWLDYTVRKEFNTLAEWVADAGDTMENVLYGVNRVHKKDVRESYITRKYVCQTPKYVTLQHLLNYLGYVPPMPVEVPEYKALDRFVDILAKLALSDIPMTPQGQKCLVQRPDNTIVVGNIVDRKQYSLDDMDSPIYIAVPRDSTYCSVNTYTSLSEMPIGTTVYLRTSDGHFRSTYDLLSNQ
jgi:hypothetical protein